MQVPPADLPKIARVSTEVISVIVRNQLNALDATSLLLGIYIEMSRRYLPMLSDEVVINAVRIALEKYPIAKQPPTES